MEQKNINFLCNNQLFYQLAFVVGPDSLHVPVLIADYFSWYPSPKSSLKNKHKLLSTLFVAYFIDLST